MSVNISSGVTERAPPFRRPSCFFGLSIALQALLPSAGRATPEALDDLHLVLTTFGSQDHHDLRHALSLSMSLRLAPWTRFSALLANHDRRFLHQPGLLHHTICKSPGTPTPRAFRPPTPAAQVAHARLLSWFLDALAALFGVHQMALEGKAAGKDVGMWFRSSAAAGALRTLVDAFAVAVDGTFHQADVFAASYSPACLHHELPARAPHFPRPITPRNRRASTPSVQMRTSTPVAQYRLHLTLLSVIRGITTRRYFHRRLRRSPPPTS
ncbi:hypothetical protein B0H16DRAFT_1897221 [Mycena metata]|uniref:Cysteine protease n=1 Tax=Mycena metata TaxID=1033252 RepID=A0AAD7HG07_9AGAR|nr:hypothetical protein B0H16DRAFT_1897221 [Mycena metata]